MPLFSGINSYSKKSLFIINSNISLNSLELLSSLKYKSCGNIEVRSVDEALSNSNFYEWGKRDKVHSLNLGTKSKLCIISSSNLRAENTLLNLKLRLKFNKRNIDVYSVGFYAASNFNISVLSLQLSQLFYIFAGKNPVLSAKLLHEISPVVIVGASANNRSEYIQKVCSFAKAQIPTLVWYSTTTSNNTEAAKFFFLRPLNSRSKIRYNNKLFLNVDERELQAYYVNGLQAKSQRNLFFSAHNSLFSNRAKYVYPVLDPFFEESGIYLNFEQRAQQANPLPTSRALLSSFDVLSQFFKGFKRMSLKSANASLKEFPISVIGLLSSQIQPLATNTKVYAFFLETLAVPHLFKTLITGSTYSQELFASKFLFSIYSYPDKCLLEDFFLSNSSLRNSRTMLQCSREARKSYNVFSF